MSNARSWRLLNSAQNAIKLQQLIDIIDLAPKVSKKSTYIPVIFASFLTQEMIF